MLQDAPPAKIADLLQAPDLSGHVILLSTSSDIDRNGRLSTEWLFVTEKEILVICGEETPKIIRRVPLDQITEFRTYPLIGSGFLQGQVDGLWVDLIRYSNRLTSRFRQACLKLDGLCKRHEYEIEGDVEEQNHCCRQCGVVLRFSGDICPRCVPRKRLLLRVWSLLRPYRDQAILMCGLSLFAVGIELIPPLLQQVLVDRILKIDAPPSKLQSLTQFLLLLVGGLAAVRLSAAVVAIWKGRVSSRVGTALTADLRTQMVQKLHSLPVSYHDGHQVGMLMSRISYDTEVMHTLLQQLTSGFLLQLLQLLGIGGMLFYLNPKLAFFTLLPMPVVVVGSWFFSRRLFPLNQRYWDAVGKQAAALTGMLSGIRVVKAFTQEIREYQRFRGSSDRLRDSRRNVDVSTVTFSSCMAFIFGLGALVVWYVGGRDVLIHEMTLGSLMAFLAYLAMFYTPLTTLSESTTWISSFTAATHRIFELLDTPAQIKEPEAPQPIDQLRGRIQFDRVTFAYEENQPVLKNVSFTIEPGEMVGIVGRSGSGKSTLVSLIARLYDAGSGNVTIDGVNVRQMSSHDLRRKIGMVLQESFLFEGTIETNIVYGRPEASPEEILRAARAANAHDFILRMPFAYETMLGERGVGLSGGEKQRLSIARAFLYEPRILILDEATSSVDTESERAIQEALRNFSKGRTTIAVAHRLSTLKDANRLLVFDQGRLVEQGTHEQLVTAGGIYASLVRIQSSFQSAAREFEAVAHGTGLQQQAGALSATVDSGGPDAATGLVDGGDGRVDDGSTSPAYQDLRWLTPQESEFHLDLYEIPNLSIGDAMHRGVYAIRAFPSSHPDEYISLLCIDHNGSALELGMIRRLSDWPDETQQLLRHSLDRHYLVRVIRSLDDLSLQQGFLNCAVKTDDGPLKFLMQTNRDGVKPHGKNGRLLLDVDENHYLIPDIAQLPANQQRMLARHFAE